MNLKAALISLLLGSPLTVESDRSHNIKADGLWTRFYTKGVLWEQTACEQLFPDILFPDTLFPDVVCYQQLTGEAQLCHQDQASPTLDHPNLITYFIADFKGPCYLLNKQSEKDNSCETIPAPVSFACFQTARPARSF